MTDNVQSKAEDIITKAHKHDEVGVLTALNTERRMMTDPQFNDMLKQITDKDPALKVVAVGDKSQVFLEMPSPFPFCKPSNDTMYNSDDYDKNKDIALNQPGDYNAKSPGEVFFRAARVMAGEFGQIEATIAELHKGA